MSDLPFELSSYFTRIGYDGPRSPTLATLRAIHARHPQAIPFENLDVLLRRPVRIDLASIARKLIEDERGGYCFEQNGLLAAVLRAIGFQVTPIAARVRWGVPAGTPRPRTHMLLRVDLEEGPFLADVGFGALSMTAPLDLEKLGEQETPHEPLRLAREGEARILQAKLGDEWVDTYAFTLEPENEADYEMANWYTSTHPQSRFVQNLIVTRTNGAGRRVTLHNRELVFRDHGAVTKRSVDTADELLEVLSAQFGLRFPSGTRFGSPGSPWPT